MWASLKDIGGDEWGSTLALQKLGVAIDRRSSNDLILVWLEQRAAYHGCFFSWLSLWNTRNKDKTVITSGPCGQKYDCFRRHTDGQQAHEKMFNITHCWGDANQSHSEIDLIPSRMAIIRKTTNNKCWPFFFIFNKRKKGLSHLGFFHASLLTITFGGLFDLRNLCLT